jgi:hypothetical protein
LTGARIVVSPEKTLPRGTVVIRDGVIEAVGASISVPPDARVWAMDSLTVYAGLIDAFRSVAAETTREGTGQAGRSVPAEAGPAAGIPGVTPERILADEVRLTEEERKDLRAVGFTTVRGVPGWGTFRGRAVVLNLGDGSVGENLLVREAGQVLAFDTGRGQDYPNSLMGAVAVLRQTLYDARWYREAHAAYAERPVGTERPPTSASLAALVPAANGDESILFVTDDVLDILRAGRLQEEFGLVFDFRGSGEEYKRIEEVRGVLRGDLVVPVAFPELPEAGDPGKELEVSLEMLRAWDEAPRNPARLSQAGIPFALTADGLKTVSEFPGNVNRAVEEGLATTEALAAVTTVPAAMLGLADRLGTIEKGKIANLVVTRGDLFADSTEVREVWIDGKRYEKEKEKPGGRRKAEGKRKKGE